MPRVYIGIGSNVDRQYNIQSGIRLLSQLGTSMTVSRVYESRAVGFQGDNFYNLVIGMDTDLSAYELNRKLREIEDRYGRLRDVSRFSSRTLDLDLLIYGDMVVHDQELDVPRDDILTYAFVLKPLVEIAAEVIHPETGVKLGEIWDSFNGQSQEIWEVDFKPDSKGLSPSIEGMN